jgi:hypothetical protein
VKQHPADTSPERIPLDLAFGAAVLIALFVVAMALPFGLRYAAAQSTAPVSTSVRDACREDVRALCAGVLPGGGRIRQCMKEKRDQLSDACKSALAARLQSPK